MWGGKRDGDGYVWKRKKDPRWDRREMGIGESGEGGICGKEAKRGESTRFEGQKFNKRGASTEFVATMCRL